jgi:hypothetical protein
VCSRAIGRSHLRFSLYVNHASQWHHAPHSKLFLAAHGDLSSIAPELVRAMGPPGEVGSLRRRGTDPRRSSVRYGSQSRRTTTSSMRVAIDLHWSTNRSSRSTNAKKGDEIPQLRAMVAPAHLSCTQRQRHIAFLQMPMRAYGLTVASLLLCFATTARAEAISGTITGSFTGNKDDIPQVPWSVSLTCSLVCEPSAPTLHYRMRSGVSWNYASSLKESADYVSTAVSNEIDPTGQYSSLLTGTHGTATVLRAPAVTCECGGRIGQGGYIDLVTQPILIPPKIAEPFMFSNTEYRVAVSAKPRGGETLEVTFVGAGLNVTQSLTQKELEASNQYVSFFPTAGGDIAITASLKPWNTASSITYNLESRTTTPGPAAGQPGPAKTPSTTNAGGCSSAPDSASPLLLMCLIPLLGCRRLHRKGANGLGIGFRRY